MPRSSGCPTEQIWFEPLTPLIEQYIVSPKSRTYPTMAMSGLWAIKHPWQHNGPITPGPPGVSPQKAITPGSACFWVAPASPGFWLAERGHVTGWNQSGIRHAGRNCHQENLGNPGFPAWYLVTLLKFNIKYETNIRYSCILWYLIVLWDAGATSCDEITQNMCGAYTGYIVGRAQSTYLL